MESLSQTVEKHPVQWCTALCMAVFGGGVGIMLLFAMLGQKHTDVSTGRIIFYFIFLFGMMLGGIKWLIYLKNAPEKISYERYVSMWSQEEFILMNNVSYEYVSKLTDSVEKKEFEKYANKYQQTFTMYCSAVLGRGQLMKPPSSSSIVYSAAIGNAIGGPAAGIAMGISAANEVERQQVAYEITKQRVSQRDYELENYKRALKDDFSNLMSIIQRNAPLKEDWEKRWKQARKEFDKEYRY